MTRSPNYPAIGLPDAVSLAKKVWESEKRTPISEERLASIVGYTSLSGLARVKISAMKKYGLLDKDGANWKLSDRALAILHKPKITREYAVAVRAAVDDVDLFSELLRTHSSASADTLRHHLIVDRRFTEDGAASFIKAFLATKSLVFNGEPATIQGEKADQARPQPGDLVQWESQGVQQFLEPKRVAGLSDDGIWVFLDGEKSAAPAEQVTVVTKADEADTQPKRATDRQPPRNPFSPEQSDQARFTMTLPGEGDLVLLAPKRLSPDSLELIESWLKRCWKQLTKPAERN